MYDWIYDEISVGWTHDGISVNWTRLGLGLMPVNIHVTPAVTLPGVAIRDI